MWLIIFIVLPFKYVQTPNRSKHEIQNPSHKMLHLKEIYKLRKMYGSIINIPDGNLVASLIMNVMIPATGDWHACPSRNSAMTTLSHHFLCLEFLGNHQLSSSTVRSLGLLLFWTHNLCILSYFGLISQWYLR